MCTQRRHHSSSLEPSMLSSATLDFILGDRPQLPVVPGYQGWICYPVSDRWMHRKPYERSQRRSF